jgi:hypothetical protein
MTDTIILKTELGQGGHGGKACNPSKGWGVLAEAEGYQGQPGLHNKFETHLGNIVRTCLIKKE